METIPIGMETILIGIETILIGIKTIPTGKETIFGGFERKSYSKGVEKREIMPVLAITDTIYRGVGKRVGGNEIL